MVGITKPFNIRKKANDVARTAVCLLRSGIKLAVGKRNRLKQAESKLLCGNLTRRQTHAFIGFDPLTWAQQGPRHSELAGHPAREGLPGSGAGDQHAQGERQEEE